MLDKTPWFAPGWKRKTGRIPWPPPKKKKRPAWRLTHDTQQQLIKLTVRLMRHSDPTPFRLEGPRRYSLRGTLCLMGWPWPIADATAAAIVRAALDHIGARRPFWAEGQREYAHFGFLRDDVCHVAADGCRSMRKNSAAMSADASPIANDGSRTRGFLITAPTAARFCRSIRPPADLLQSQMHPGQL